MPIPASDKVILRDLGRQVADIAALPIQAQRRENHARINNLQHAKPTIHIYQVPWHEMNVNGELTLRCEDAFCRGIEKEIRQTLYSWRHMPGDMVVTGVIAQPLCIRDSGFGLAINEDVARIDPNSDVVSHRYKPQIRDGADVEKIKLPEVSYDETQTLREFEMRQEIFDGVLPVKIAKIDSFWFAPWDELVQWTGVTEILTDMILRPDYVNLLIDRLVTAWLYRLDQYEALGLLSAPTQDLWGVGAAQIFSAVSPQMHAEFALRHEARWYIRWGRNYYGCCEPLDHKVGVLRQHIPNLRKISMSPWVNFDRAVENVADEFIFAWKPNPAVLAAETWDPDYVRRDMEEKLHKARDCVVEIHMKDISTVRYQPHRLWEWSRIAAEVTEKYAV